MDDRERTIRTISDHLARAMLAAVEYSDRHQPAPAPPAPVIRGRGELLSTEEVSELIGITVHTLYQWRSHRPPHGPQAFKVGKYLRWKPEVVQAWIDAQSE